MFFKEMYCTESFYDYIGVSRWGRGSAGSCEPPYGNKLFHFIGIFKRNQVESAN